MSYHKLILFVPLLFCCCSCEVEDIVTSGELTASEVDTDDAQIQWPGGWFPDDELKPKYYKLAKKAIYQFHVEHPTKLPQKVVRVEEASYQIVAGLNSRITFLATDDNPYSSGRPCAICTAHIFEPLSTQIDKKMQINVSCSENKIAPIAHNASDPKYRKLAKRSLDIYLVDRPGLRPHAVDKVESVTTMVVTGVLTEIIFTAQSVLLAGNQDDEFLLCHSKIWDQAWVNKEEITVKCIVIDE